MKRLLLVFFSISFGMVSCNNDCDDMPEEPDRKKFEGTYNVTKLENQQQYPLKISFDTLPNSLGENKLHIIYENLDASFDSLFGVFFNSSNINRLRNFDAPFGVEDYNGSRWSLSLLADDPETPELENTLVNDTILFYFQKSNIAFYLEDGVPFYECECKHLAVKVE